VHSLPGGALTTFTVNLTQIFFRPGGGAHAPRLTSAPLATPMGGGRLNLSGQFVPISTLNVTHLRDDDLRKRSSECQATIEKEGSDKDSYHDTSAFSTSNLYYTCRCTPPPQRKSWLCLWFSVCLVSVVTSGMVVLL